MANRTNVEPVAPPVGCDVVPGRTGSESITVIKRSKGWVPLQLRSLWAYRELLLFMVLRDVKVRYKQTFFGVAWAVLQPLFSMLVFSIFFGHFAKLPSDGVPYPILTMCAVTPWQLFQYSLSQSSNSVVTNQALIKKVYFPRLVVPIAAVLDGLVDFGVGLVLVIAMMALYGLAPTLNAVFLPLFVVFAIVTALSVGVWLSAINVQYRDVRYTVPFLSQLWMYASPVAYSITIIPQRWRWLYGLNPMVGVIEGFRWALIGREAPNVSAMLTSVAVVLVLLVTGFIYFRRVEASFADVI